MEQAKWLSEEALQIAEKRKEVKGKEEKEKWLSEEALQIDEKRRETKGKGKKERYTFECRVPKKTKEK